MSASLPTTQKKFLIASRPQGNVTKENFKLSENEKVTMDLKEGELLVRVIYLSVDPTLRGWMSEKPHYTPVIPIGSPMKGLGLGQVIKSNNNKYKEGDLVVGSIEFAEYSVVEDNDWLSKVNDIPKFPLHVAMNNFGLTGMTAYFGMTKKGEPKEGETVVISGAAGATGLAAHYVAKAMGARTVGIAGTDEKCKNLVEKHGFVGAINYKSQNVKEELKKLCPKGIDVFFDNVGGPLLDDVLTLIAPKARIVICGAISQYNNEGEWYGIKNYAQLLITEGQMRGLFLSAHRHEFHEAAKQIHEWLEQGKMPVLPVTLHKGFEKAVDAFIGLFTGDNEGKTLVEVSAPPAPYHD